MNRRRSTLLCSLAAMVLAGGCTTFSDQDAIARVNDVELDQDQFDEMLPLVADPANLPSGATAGAARTTISVWLEAQVFTQALSDAGIDLDPAALEATASNLTDQFPSFTDVSDRTRDLLVEYVTGIDQLPALPRPDDADLAAWFDAGPATSGLACVSHILVETEEEAEQIVEELDEAHSEGGNAAEAEVFATLAAERSLDPGSGATGGFLTCDLADTISQQFVAPFAEATLAAKAGEPTDPVQSDFGYHVIRLQTFEESTLQLEPFFESGYVQARLAIDDADIHVDSRFGTADGLNVVPLG